MQRTPSTPRLTPPPYPYPYRRQEEGGKARGGAGGAHANQAMQHIANDQEERGPEGETTPGPQNGLIFGNDKRPAPWGGPGRTIPPAAAH